MLTTLGDIWVQKGGGETNKWRQHVACAVAPAHRVGVCSNGLREGRRCPVKTSQRSRWQKVHSVFSPVFLNCQSTDQCWSVQTFCHSERMWHRYFTKLDWDTLLDLLPHGTIGLEWVLWKQEGPVPTGQRAADGGGWWWEAPSNMVGRWTTQSCSLFPILKRACEAHPTFYTRTGLFLNCAIKCSTWLLLGKGAIYK